MLSVALSDACLRDAKLYTGLNDAGQAVEHVVAAHGRLIADLRAARRQLEDQNIESARIDLLEQKLKAIATQILDL
ncbi:hypothetical protein [Pseudomonas benzopyrenica]|uniref:hypothetical protein n=1 Tax=Pseudomonas benzopyrenica TaxID=2993566 RepID=UPI002280EE58|nr:hypothetical protein [Pseudomonas benzopyrenica]MDC7830252.1 hypothetical protein [Pseudomonas benzopyrenica]MDC7830255.1 hypothetical protein [Pseudomonas benzopyrenica]